MKRVLALISVASIWASVALADDLTMQQALELFSAIKSLDAYERVTKDAGVEKSIRIPFKFSASTRIALAKNVLALRDCVEAFQSAYSAKIGEGDGVQQEKFQQELMKSGCSCGLSKLTFGDLVLDENPISPSILAALGPMLEK